MKEYKTMLPKYHLTQELSDFKRVKITSSKDAAEYARNFYSSDIGIYESVFIMLLNNANNTIGYVKISQGGIVGTVVDVRIVVKYAIEALAIAVIMVHNHPSSRVAPSVQDKDLTKKIKQALSFMDIKLLDHIIIGPDVNEYFSFADDNLI